MTNRLPFGLSAAGFLAALLLACATAHAAEGAAAGGATAAISASADSPLDVNADASLRSMRFTALPDAPRPQTRAASQFGGMQLEQATRGALPLSLDDAIERGLAHNVQVLLASQTERSVRGQISTVFYELLPNMSATGYTDAVEIDLAALGFKPSLVASFGLNPASFAQIVKLDVTSAQLNVDQVLFSLPDFYLYAAARKAANVVAMNTLNERGGVVDAVGTQYLAALADEAQIVNAQALLKADEELLRQATLMHDAGVGINLDVLRARVQLQNEQQELVQAQNTFAKDKIALNRLMGQPAGQELTLTDAVPYADLAEIPLDQAKALAYKRRKDLLGLEAQLEVADRSSKAVKYERMPSLAFSGNYGVIGLTHGDYHGEFAAQGVLKIPIFEEARFRGESATAAAQETGLRHQIESLRVTIDAEIRSSRLDVESYSQLVKVAQSNVNLATEALGDTRDRFTSGVDDNLPVVQAQAALENAQSQLITAEFRFNRAKLALARNTGVVETEYKQYLGR